MQTSSNKGLFFCCCCSTAPSLPPQWAHSVAYVSDLSTVPSKSDESTEKKERKRSLKLKYEKIEQNYRMLFSQTTKWFQNEGIMQGSDDNVLNPRALTLWSCLKMVLLCHQQIASVWWLNTQNTSQKKPDLCCLNTCVPSIHTLVI